MRHRIVSGTGLGNPDKALLSNKGEINQESTVIPCPY